MPIAAEELSLNTTRELKVNKTTDHSKWLETQLYRFRFYLLGLILLAAAALRLYVLLKAHFVVDGDEAVSGIMARRVFSRGELALFFYGQPYMAPTDAWVAAPFMALFGGSGWIKAGPFIWSLVLVGFNWQLARRFFASELAGIFSALLSAFPALYFTVNNLRALGSYTLTLVLGAWLLLVAQKLVFEEAEPERQNHRWLALGLLTGFSFYVFWLAIYYYLPVFFFLLLKDKLFFLRKSFQLFLAGFMLGSLPFWLFNLFGGFETFRYFLEPKPGGGPKPAAGDVLSFFFNQSLLVITGAENYWQKNPDWVYWGLVAGWLLIWFGWVIARFKGWLGWFRLDLKPGRPVDMLLLLVLLSPAVYLLTGIGNNALALPGVDTTGRYLLPVMAIGPLLAGGALAKLPFRPGWLKIGLAGVGMLVLLACQLIPYRSQDYPNLFQTPYYMNIKPPLENKLVLAYLQTQGIEYAVCNHWIGNRLLLDSAEAVKCVDYYDIKVSNGAERFPELTRAIEEPGRKVGFVLVNPGGGPTPLEARLNELGVTFSRNDISPYTVIIPVSRVVAPSEVINALYYPY